MICLINNRVFAAYKSLVSHRKIAEIALGYSKKLMAWRE